MPVTIALAGDTMLGRGVADSLARVAPADLVAPEIAALTRSADLCLLNLECCISARGRRWPDPRKPFFFRAPPVAVEFLVHLGVDAVTLANNHALDFGPEALTDTLAHLADAGIQTVGAGRDGTEARRPIVLAADGLRIAVIAVTDHPADFAAGPGRPGVAYADLRGGSPRWLTAAIDATRADADLRLVTPHWGPNMTPGPVPHVRAAARDLLAAGAELVAGHSAHVFHGARLTSDPRRAVLYDLGGLIDDYAVDRVRRNDLGLLWLVTLDRDGPTAVEAVPLRLRFAHTQRATGHDRATVVGRLTDACAAFGTRVVDTGDRLVLRDGGPGG